jgi:hypothetical protein
MHMGDRLGGVLQACVLSCGGGVVARFGNGKGKKGVFKRTYVRGPACVYGSALRLLFKLRSIKLLVARVIDS